MRLLICGMHRSGTSAVAGLLAAASGRSFLEDPDWAMTGDLVDVAGHADELARWDIVKCPRMTEVLPRALEVCPGAGAAVLVRDPRDVLASILEKVRAGMPTRMLEFSRLGVTADGAEAFGAAYRIYADTIRATAAGPGGHRVRIVVYEEFCADRATAVRDLATWMGWPWDPRTVAAREHEQLGPVHTKHDSDQTIKGPRRWTRDLEPADVAALDDAVAAYATLRELSS